MNILLLFTLNMLAAVFQYNHPPIAQKEAVKQEAATALCLGPTVSIKVFLEGPFNATTGKMTDGLRTTLAGLAAAGVGSNMSEPYSSAPYNTSFTHVLGGGEIANANVFNGTATAVINGVSTPNYNVGDNAIVDWVFVELRDPTTPTTVVATQAALLQVDGDVVDVNGYDPVTFPTGAGSKYASLTCGGNFVVGIRHRNHLAIRTTVAMQLTSQTKAIDFTAVVVAVEGATNVGVVGTNPRQTITLSAGLGGGTVKALYSGDTNNSNAIDATDRANTWNDRNLPGYQKNDCSMNGTVDATDRANTWNNRNKTNL